MEMITVNSLSKGYRSYTSKLDKIKSIFFSKKGNVKYVLDDISFSVNRGECVGIIGKNGAGKSTLLKIITGIIQPTKGEAKISGKVIALLELGMGFNSDYSGRKNAMISGQLLGVDSETIKRKLPEIEKFAGIGKYFDQPVRVYSSGMKSRVAFAVASCFEPDILIVDEALSVGDIAFQSKCIMRMEELMKSGVTVLFVSHSLNQIKRFCNRTVYLSDGKIKGIGKSDEICDIYEADLAEDSRDQTVDAVEPENNNELTISDVKAYNDARQLIEFVHPGQRILVEVTIEANCNIKSGGCVGFLISDRNGYQMASLNSNFYNRYLPKLEKGQSIKLRWDFEWPFSKGDYRVDIGIKEDLYTNVFYDRVFCALVLSTQIPRKLNEQNFGAPIFPNSTVTIEELNEK
ncbi:ABC transporter ATP-binding protein [Vibrio mediterranei]